MDWIFILDKKFHFQAKPNIFYFFQAKVIFNLNLKFLRYLNFT